jgi:hypothetical protein
MAARTLSLAGNFTQRNTNETAAAAHLERRTTDFARAARNRQSDPLAYGVKRRRAVATRGGAWRISRRPLVRRPVRSRKARDSGFPESKINGPDNLVRIPTLKHWQINAWYQKKNDQFGGLSPREYLRDKSWEERRRIGIDALSRFGVLKQ